MLMRTPGRVDYHPVLQENRLEAEVTRTSYLSKTEKDMYIYIFFSIKMFFNLISGPSKMKGLTFRMNGMEKLPYMKSMDSSLISYNKSLNNQRKNIYLSRKLFIMIQIEFSWNLCRKQLELKRKILTIYQLKNSRSIVWYIF